MMSQPAVVNQQGPIADLSYRNYDGVLKTRALRWWIISVAVLRRTFRHWAFWVLAALLVFPYVLGGFWIYFLTLLQQPGAGVGIETSSVGLTGQRFGIHFYQALMAQGWCLLGLSLLIGAGLIAADNRSNALLVYLSKPVTKGDYLIGKWMGLFLVLLSVTLAPALLLYLFCAAMFATQGFFREEPLLPLRILASSAVASAFHTSLIIGISAWSRRPLLAGAAYAGLYFVAASIAGATVILMRVAKGADPRVTVLPGAMSFQGLVDGVTWNIYGIVYKDVLFNPEQGVEFVDKHAPAFWLVGLIMAALVVLALAAARARVRAVEVVTG